MAIPAPEDVHRVAVHHRRVSKSVPRHLAPHRNLAPALVLQLQLPQVVKPTVRHLFWMKNSEESAIFLQKQVLSGL